MYSPRCLPLESDVFQGPTQHYYDFVPQSLWNECNATDSPNEVIRADTSGQWMSLNFISTSSILELTCKDFQFVFENW